MPNETKTAATTTAKVSKIHDPMLTLQRAVAYIVLFVLCFICLFFFYVLIVNATHNNSVSYTHLTLPTILRV